MVRYVRQGKGIKVIRRRKKEGRRNKLKRKGRRVGTGIGKNIGRQVGRGRKVPPTTHLHPRRQWGLWGKKAQEGTTRGKGNMCMGMGQAGEINCRWEKGTQVGKGCRHKGSMHGVAGRLGKGGGKGPPGKVGARTGA